MKKYIFLLLFACCLIFNIQAQNKIELFSPNGEIKVSIRLSDKIYYDVSCSNEKVLENNSLMLALKEQVLGEHPKLSGQKRKSVKETLTPIVPLKFASIDNEYNQLLLNFRDNYSVEFRAFNDGIAYRFITRFKKDIEVIGEDFSLQLPSEYLLHLQQPEGFKTGYEEFYSHIPSTSWKPSDRMSVLPILIDTHKSYKILVCEADLSDYPCMFLKSDGNNNITSVFPKVPLEFGDDGDRSLKILKEADYIAKTNGKRSFPWRYFSIVKEDKHLVENTMTYKLAAPNQLQDVSWIKPGQVSWEWWNGAIPYGEDVTFKAGCNLATYKYYIDFAAKYGIPYILMDEGWAKTTQDPYTPNPDVDLHELIRYGKEKNVDIILWLSWLTVEKNFDLFKVLGEWGVKGIKIDFMDRSDQWMVNFYERVAKEAAKHHLLIDFHGAFKPAGLEYRYPNILSYEGVKGMEHMWDCLPDNSVYLPFMRNAVGPMDYTPGAMITLQPNVYRTERPNSASIGTRAYQLALYVIFESGLQMLADNPTLYYRNEDCTRFITQVPTTWDETIVLDAKIGEYVIVAKRKGEKWFIGGMTNSKEEERNFEISLDFLKTDRCYHLTAFEDGINASRQAMHYKRRTLEVKQGQRLSIRMAKSGGFAGILE